MAGYKRKRSYGRRRGGIRGRGGYLGDMWNSYKKYIPRVIGGVGGMLAGGGPGAAAGYTAGEGLSKAFGWGAYRFRGKGAYSRSGKAGTVGNQLMGYDKPITVNSSNDETGDIFMSHREFVGNVYASVTGDGTASSTRLSSFTISAYDINAGLTQSFPWLSQIAQCFTMYELQGLVYEYRPTSGDFGSTGSNALGKVIMATQYDPDAADFLSAIQMENYDYANSAKPSEHMLHGVETSSKQSATKMLYIRTGPTQRDKIFTDVGTFQIATEGVPIVASATSGVVTSAVIGELWISYRIKLSRAQLTGSYLGNQIPLDIHVGQSASAALFDTACLPAYTSYYGSFTSTYMQKKLTNTIGSTVRNISSSGLQQITITLPTNIVTGFYAIFCWSWENAGGDMAPMSWAEDTTTTKNASFLGSTNYGYLGPAGASFPAPNAIPAGTSTASLMTIVSVNAPGALNPVIGLQSTSATDVITTTMIYVMQIPQTATLPVTSV